MDRFVKRALIAAGIASMFVVLPTFASDEDVGLRPRYADCMRNAMTTAAMLTCSGNEFSFQDKRLNKAYRDLMSQVSEPRKTELRTAERQWLAKKRKQCAPPADGGTADQVSSADCEVEQTARQAANLEKQLKK